MRYIWDGFFLIADDEPLQVHTPVGVFLVVLPDDNNWQLVVAWSEKNRYTLGTDTDTGKGAVVKENTMLTALRKALARSGIHDARSSMTELGLKTLAVVTDEEICGQGRLGFTMQTLSGKLSAFTVETKGLFQEIGPNQYRVRSSALENVLEIVSGISSVLN